MFTFNDREMYVLENYAISRYRSNFIYFILCTGLVLVTMFTAFYYGIEYIYTGVCELQAQVNLLAQLDEHAVDPNYQADDKAVIEPQKDPRKGERIESEIFDLNQKADRIYFSWCYVLFKWALPCCRGPSGEPVADLFDKYYTFITKEVMDESNRMKAMRTYDLMATHLSDASKSDHAELYQECFKYFSTINWDSGDRNARHRLNLLEVASQEIAMVKKDVGASILNNMKSNLLSKLGQ